MKERIDKLGILKITISLLCKTLSREWEDKLQTYQLGTAWEKIAAKDPSDKEQLSKINEELLKLKKGDSLIKKKKKKGPKTLTDTSPKKIQREQISM